MPLIIIILLKGHTRYDCQTIDKKNIGRLIVCKSLDVDLELDWTCPDKKENKIFRI
jgi:hypothetical protein